MIKLGDYDRVCHIMKTEMKIARKRATGNPKQREHQILRAGMLAVLEAERGQPSAVIFESARQKAQDFYHPGKKLKIRKAA